jgi:hypothetical protein
MVETGNKRDALRKQHDAALGELTAAHVLEPDVAAAIRQAFEEVLVHLRMRDACCYAVFPLEAEPREDLTVQAAALAEMAGLSEIDSTTVARAQAALEHDMAWLAQFRAGLPARPLETVEPTPAEREAAQVMVLLLSKRR